MNTSNLVERMRSWPSEIALVTGTKSTQYDELISEVESWLERLADAKITAGSVVSIEGDYSPTTVAALFAVWMIDAIAVPLAPDSASHHDQFCETAEVQFRIQLQQDEILITSTQAEAQHELYVSLRERSHPGLVLFTSGTSGPNKAAVHDVAALLNKYETPRQRLRTLVFLQMDHIGGINTLLYTFSNGGCVIVASERTPRDICQAIEQNQVELLPTSPTFLNMMLLSGEFDSRDLSSLRVITYGTEPMPETTLKRLAQKLPDVRLKQTYGMTELGILGSKSRASDSLWVRVGGDGFETKIIDNRLWVRAKTAMMGYLNAPSPFDEDGFLDTGDRVEVDGEWIKILGRDGDTINVGGSKVDPAEVENVLLQLEGVADVVVKSEAHPITGQIVSALVQLTTSEPFKEFKVRARQHCKELLPSYAVPARFRKTDQPLHSSRFKRIR
ncbi:MAG: AMP-dependent synthetase [Blastopirellula sp.]|nr:MAG: AMP-dependent synthetase [Blastopirellula sp.]